MGFDILKDPEGTQISTISSSGNSSNYEAFYLEMGPYIRCDDNNIMYSYSGEFLIYGRVAGLAQVTDIPSNPQWSDEVSVVPGYGYILRFAPSSSDSQKYAKYLDSDGYLYGRLYCIYSVGAVGSNGGRIVNVFKHQSPFTPSNTK